MQPQAFPLQKLFHVAPGQGLAERGIGAEDALGELLFLILEREDFLLDGTADDQFVAEYRLGLSDPVRSVGGLIFNRRVPPGIVVEHVIRGSEIQSGSACLEADEEQRWAGGIIELIDTGHAVASTPVEIEIGQILRIRLLSEKREHLGELTEHQRSMTLGDEVADNLVVPRQLGARWQQGAGRQLQEAGIAADLPKSGERRKDRDPAPAEAHFFDRFEDRAPALLENFAVERGLTRLHFAVGDDFRLRRQLLGHFVLQTSEHERMNSAAKPIQYFGFTSYLDRHFVALGEVFQCAKKSRHQEIKNAPQLPQSVLQRGSGKREALLGGERLAGLSRRGIGIFDILS